MTAVSRGDPVMWSGVSEHVAVLVYLRTSRTCPGDGDVARVTHQRAMLTLTVGPTPTCAGHVSVRDPGL